MSVRVRFAPSPTGHLHVGGARTALFNYYFAQHHGGTFVLRIEDTDKKRSSQEYEEGILKGMEWLGMKWDEGPFYQSQRQENYLKYAQKLIDQGKAYKCYCTPEEITQMREEASARKEKPRYNRKWRDREAGESEKNKPYAIRFKAPLEGEVVVNDLILGEIRVSNEEGDDFIIVRSDGSPTYQLSVVVDDLEMGITHVIRGDDHMSNTPKQILLWQALGEKLPNFAHVPMILGADKAKLSKRHGAVAVFNYKEQGFLPEAFRNALIRMGWSHGDQEIFSNQELVDLFNLDSCGKSPSVFDQQKLKWINQQFISKLSEQEFLKEVQTFTGKDYSGLFQTEASQKLLQALKERCELLTDFSTQASFLNAGPVEYEESCVSKVLEKTDKSLIQGLFEKLKSEAEIKAEAFFPLLKEHAESQGVGVGKIAKAVRVLLTGNLKSPDLGLVAEVLSKKIVLERLEMWLRS